jgi:hypothetical protein
MTFRTDEQLEAIRRFKDDHFPTLASGVVSKDIVKVMREDLALIVADPVVPLAVAVETSAPEIPAGDPLEAAVEFVGIREEEPAPKTKRGKNA